MPDQKSLPNPDSLPGLRNPPRLAGVRPFFAAAAIFFAIAARPAAAAEAWDPVDPALLAETSPKLEADASAEAVFRRVKIDDDDYPEERIFSEYDRYKIFAPERATTITRIARQEVTVDGERLSGRLEIRARLTLPDGTSKEFGDESIQQRAITRIGTEQNWFQRLTNESGEVDEKFLAVTGMVPGSVLDVRIVRRVNGVMQRMVRIGPINETLQLSVPTRQLEFRHILADSDRYSTAPFLLSSSIYRATIEADPKKKWISVRARDLPALAKEPLSGPLADYALTYLSDDLPRHGTFLTHHGTSREHFEIDRKAGPWAGIATIWYMTQEDMAAPSYRLRDLAKKIVAGASSKTAKAIRIHRFVQDRYWRFLRSAHHQRLLTTIYNEIETVDQILDADTHPNYAIPSRDFTWLALTLYQAAGLEAQAVLMPNRAFVEFDPRLVANMFLPNIGVRVRVDGQWKFSCQNTTAPVAFGMVPWQWSGQGLVIQPNKQEFVPIPPTPALQTVVTNTGKFELAEDGSLSGDGQRALTGQVAYDVRTRMLRAKPGKQKSIFREMLAKEFKSGTIEILNVAGADDPDSPLTVSYHVESPDFAARTKERMIFQPSLFHATDSAFASSTRHYAIRFPYGYVEQDRAEIHFPDDYQVETRWAPPSFPGGSLSYLSKMSYIPAQRVFILERTYGSNAAGIPLEDYARFKQWIDQTEAADRHDLVLVRSGGPAPPPPVPPASPAPRT
jgi:hypothetical protein